MRLLVIHEVNYLAKIVYEFQILPEILSMLGHDITIIDYDDSWRSTPAPSVFQLRTTVFSDVHRAYPEASVVVRRPGMVRLPVVSRLSGAAASAVEIFRTLREQKFDTILLYGVPTVGLQALCAARSLGVPVFFRSIDVLHRLVPNRTLRLPTKVLERIVYRNVAGIACVTPKLKDYVEAYGVPASRVELLPSGVDVRLFSPGPRNESLLTQWGIGASDPVVLFMGTLYSFSGLDRVIGEFRKVLRLHPNARLLIAGVGEDEEKLKQLVAQNGLSAHVIFAGLQPYALLPDLIRSCDLCINPFELNPITRDILPTKLFQYLACGKPVLMTQLPGTLPFLKGPQDGVIYAPLEGFVDCLREALSDRARLTELGANALRIAQRDYDWRSLAARLVDWMERTITPPGKEGWLRQ